jgi:TolB-like protein
VAGLVLIGGGALAVSFRDRWIENGAAQVPHIRSIAVLPLDNLTGDSTREYVVDGMTDALITELLQVVSVPLISRNSSTQYKGTQKRPPDIAQELNVEGIVQDAASMTGSTVRMNVQLIHAATDRYVWAKDYERDAKDVMVLQAEVARDIATAIDFALWPRWIGRRSRRLHRQVFLNVSINCRIALETSTAVPFSAKGCVCGVRRIRALGCHWVQITSSPTKIEPFRIRARRKTPRDTSAWTPRSAKAPSNRQDFVKSWGDQHLETDTDREPETSTNSHADRDLAVWLGGRDSNPDNVVQSHVSYR